LERRQLAVRCQLTASVAFVTVPASVHVVVCGAQYDDSDIG
jgi:hypothetical protein